jgi:hypothetical protein
VKGSATTTTSTVPATTTTTIYDPPGIATDPDFTAPSSTDQALQPWDPRACNAAGTGPAVTTTTSTSSTTTTLKKHSKK